MDGRKVKYLRQILGITQKELIRDISKCQSWISKVESGRLVLKGIDEVSVVRVFQMKRDSQVEQLYDEIKLLENIV